MAYRLRYKGYLSHRETIRIKSHDNRHLVILTLGTMLSQLMHLTLSLILYKKKPKAFANQEIAESS
ncbi:hypothetical protein HanIR_Chr01g0004341 [Helianthus annuus]|nr:hypothetical protein HanIR_Chr01g0004341 [Helianthus annuus]